MGSRWFWLSSRATRQVRSTWRARLPMWVGLVWHSSRDERKVSGLYVRLGDRVWMAGRLRNVRLTTADVADWDRTRS